MNFLVWIACDVGFENIVDLQNICGLVFHFYDSENHVKIYYILWILWTCGTMPSINKFYNYLPQCENICDRGGSHGHNYFNNSSTKFYLLKDFYKVLSGKKSWKPSNSSWWHVKSFIRYDNWPDQKKVYFLIRGLKFAQNLN